MLGAVNEVPYTTRIILRRPREARSFQWHRGGLKRCIPEDDRSIFEWSRVSILTRRHIFVEIVHSPANITLLKNFNAGALRDA